MKKSIASLVMGIAMLAVIASLIISFKSFEKAFSMVNTMNNSIERVEARVCIIEETITKNEAKDSISASEVEKVKNDIKVLKKRVLNAEYKINNLDSELSAFD